MWAEISTLPRWLAGEPRTKDGLRLILMGPLIGKPGWPRVVELLEMDWCLGGRFLPEFGSMQCAHGGALGYPHNF